MTPRTWDDVVREEQAKPYYAALWEFVRHERTHHTVYPGPEHVLRALRETPLNQVRAVVLGQDPYHGPGQACGLCFSVPSGVPIPPSLRVVLQELADDAEAVCATCAGAGMWGASNQVCSTCGGQSSDWTGHVLRRLRAHHTASGPNGDLTPWARSGILLLNDVLTVRAREPGSHQAVKQLRDLTGGGWERFTDACLLAAARAAVENFGAFGVLAMGAPAGKKAEQLCIAASQPDLGRRLPISVAICVIKTPHPAARPPLTMRGSKPFSRLNRLLREAGAAPLDWSLP